MRKQNIYRPIDLAKLFGVHPNTIRLYERLGYLTKAERSEHGYRMFTDLQLLQLKLCRCIFGYPFTNRRIRNAGNEVIRASGKKQWALGMEHARAYIQAVTDEHQLAKKTAGALQNWTKPTKPSVQDIKEGHMSRKDVADRLGITMEAVRNWERNGLICQNGKGEKTV